MAVAEARNKNCLQPLRRQWAIEYLEKHGPSMVKDIAAATGVPSSSMSFVLLRYKDTFEKASRRVWQLVGQKAPEKNSEPVEWPAGQRPFWSYVD